jgi:methanogenic corrinoid protein MtbC1
LLSHEVSVAAAYVETVLERGTNLEAICLDLLAPAARELGLLWEEDECDFMQVTVGLCRLHQILRNIAPELPMESPIPGPERGILLAAVPGEQHTFGITLVAQFLMQAGWDVWQEFPRCNSDILEIVRLNWFTVVGLSIGSDTRLEELSALIKDIRAASRNREIGILAGGPVLVQRPELAAALGADATAADGQQTVRWMERVCLSRL